MFTERKPEHFSAKRQAPSAKRQAPSAKRQALRLHSFRRAGDIQNKFCVARSTKLFVSRGGLVHRIPYEFLLSCSILSESSPKYP